MEKTRELTRLLFTLSSLVDLGHAVTSGRGFADRMKSALYIVTGIFSVPRAALFGYSPARRRLELIAAKGLRDAAGAVLAVPSRQLKALAPNEPCALAALRHQAFYERNAAVFTQLQAKTLIPLFAKNACVGALTLGRRLNRPSYRASEREALKATAHQLAIALHHSTLVMELTKQAAENKRLYENMRHIYHETIQAFAAAIDAKDAYTKNHSLRVAGYAVAMARALGWKPEDVEGIYVAGLLHDIGKIIIDRNVINKEERLTPPEISDIRRHPQISYDILSKISFPWKNVVQFVRHHHERVDGTGYPDSLGSRELSDGIKILALADAFDAMTTDRPYRKRLSLREAVREVRRFRGTQFDKAIADVFFSVLERELNGEVSDPLILPHLRAAGVLERGLAGERHNSRTWFSGEIVL